MTPRKLTDSQKRYVFAWGGYFVGLGAPYLILGSEYGLFSENTTTGYKATFTFLLVTAFAIIRLWGGFSEWSSTIREGHFREVMRALARTGPYLLLFGLGYVVNAMLEDYLFITGTIAICQLSAAVLEAEHQVYRRRILKKEGYTLGIVK